MQEPPLLRGAAAVKRQSGLSSSHGIHSAGTKIPMRNTIHMIPMQTVAISSFVIEHSRMNMTILVR